MKLTGLLGTGSGKLGNSVFATIAGEQIVRQYQPVVANPSTVSQVSQRSKFKLLSQLAASMADEIAIAKDGLVSPRNKFVSINTDAATVTDGVAQIDLTSVQITNSTRTFEGKLELTVDNTGFPTIKISELGDPASADVTAGKYDSVAIALYKVKTNEQLALAYSRVIKYQGVDIEQKVTDAYIDAGEKFVVYVYGIKAGDAAAKARYASYTLVAASDIAKLIANRTVAAADLSITKTKAASATASA